MHKGAFADWGDLLKSYDSRPIISDAIGNPTNDLFWSYTWQHGRQLASMTDRRTLEQWQFTYNADGLRTQRTNGTTTYNYTYLGSQLTHMTVDGHTMYFSYDAAGIPLSMTYDGANYYYVTNIQGDVVSILNASGTEVVCYIYDAWGNLISTTGTQVTTIGFYNPLRYRGYVYDPETELYYLQSRYYDPEMGRFINADGFASTGQGVLGNNMFVYCGNNPVRNRDITGTRYIDALSVASETGDSRKLMCQVQNTITLQKHNAFSEPLLSDSDVPYRGEPGSHVTSKDGTKERIYGPDGFPQKDRHHTNHGNPKHHPHVPHDHDWGYNEKGQWKPGPGYKSPEGPLGAPIPTVSYDFEFLDFTIPPYVGDLSPLDTLKLLLSFS